MTRFEQLDIQQFEQEVRARFDEMAELLVRKRKSYGPSNLVRFGPIGIAIRAGDKVDRLATMCQNNEQSTADGESMEDAWMDLIGYGVLGLMLTQMEREPTTPTHVIDF